MANPKGTPENLRPKPWQPGESGNPNGSSRKQRFKSALQKLIDEKGFDPEIMLVMIAQAVGRRDLLEYKTKDGKTAIREPDLAWLKYLNDTLNGDEDINELWEQVEQLKAKRARRGGGGGPGSDAGDGGA